MRTSVKLTLAIVVSLFVWKIGPWSSLWLSEKASYTEFMNELENNFAKKMFNEVSLVRSGNSRRSADGKIKEVGLGFTAYRRASIEEARALQLYVMQNLIQAINENEKLVPFLGESPFTYKHVQVSISFEGINGRYCDGSVVRIFNISESAVEENRNTFFYRSKDAYTGNLIELFREPYEEAVKRASSTPIANLRVHQSTPLEKAMDEVLPPYIAEMKKTSNFICMSIGGKITDKIEYVGANFIVMKRAPLEEARKMALLATERLLEYINSNEKMRDHLIEYPFPSHRIKMRMSFRNRKGNPYPYNEGSMESTRMEGDEIAYYSEVPPHFDVHPGPQVYAKESYQEALKTGLK